jgi:ABC-type multidrug transport system ATPase subunit
MAMNIEFKSVKKSFGEVNAIDGLYLYVAEGEVYAFLGHNGAGKTTTLCLLLGLLEPNEGTVAVFGKNPLKNGEEVRGMCGVLSELAKEQGTTIIMTTHNLEEVQKMCDKISIFRHGRNIFTDSIHTLQDSAQYMENGQFSLEKLYMDIETKGVC